MTAAVPTLTCTAGKFGPTSAWAGWVPLGGTTSGFKLVVTPTFTDFEVEESFWPQAILQTKAEAAAEFTLAQLNRANLAFVFNAGSAASLAGTGGSFSTSGSGANSYVQFNAPMIGSQFLARVGFQAEGDTDVIFLYAGVNVAAVSPERKKAPQEAALLFNVRGTQPATNPDSNAGAGSGDIQVYRWYTTY